MSTPEKPGAIAKVEVVPVAGHDSMLLNLSGAHGPFFTRNIAIVTDSEGREGLGEVPGGLVLLRVAQPEEAEEGEGAGHQAPPSRAVSWASPAHEAAVSARSSMPCCRNASIAPWCSTAASTSGFVPRW